MNFRTWPAAAATAALGAALVVVAAGPNGTQLRIAACRNERRERWKLP